MRQGEVVELEIPSAPEYVSIVRQAVAGIAQRMPFGAGQIEDLKIAVGEACTNAIKHGCPGEAANHVIVRCMVHDDGLRVEVRNSITNCPSPVVPNKPDLSKEGGLGLYLMQQLVDEVDLCWEIDTATVKLTKLLR